MKEIGRGVYIETQYALVTVGAILTETGWVCIDSPPYPREAQLWRSILEKISPLPVQYVINTDHHRDRTLGNVWLNGTVIAHWKAAEAMLGHRSSLISQAAEEMSANSNEWVEIASIKFVPPQISFTDSLILHCGGRELTLAARPGATSGSAWVILSDEKIMFVGDAITVGQHPFVTDGKTKAWLTDLRNLRHERYSDWTIVSGRGDTIAPEETEKMSHYLRAARRRVGGLIRAGRSHADVNGIATELLAFFPYQNNRKEEILRRIKTGLEAIYHELRTEQDSDAEEE